LFRRILFRISVVVILLIPSAGSCLDTVTGVKAGAGIFSYIGEDYQEFLDIYNLQNDFKWGLAAGAFVTVELTDYFAFQPEILVIGAGDAFREDNAFYEAFFGNSYHGDVINIDETVYAAVPVLLKIRFWRISVFTGPTLMLMLGNGRLRLRADDEVLQYDLDSVGLSSLDYADGVFSSFTLAVTGGTGVELPFRRRRGVFSMEARGYYVFTNILDPSQGSVFRAYGILMMAGYGLDSKGREHRRSKIR
jgi:hypothetical protein